MVAAEATINEAKIGEENFSVDSVFKKAQMKIIGREGVDYSKLDHHRQENINVRALVEILHETFNLDRNFSTALQTKGDYEERHQRALFTKQIMFGHEYTDPRHVVDYLEAERKKIQYQGEIFSDSALKITLMDKPAGNLSAGYEISINTNPENDGMKILLSDMKFGQTLRISAEGHDNMFLIKDVGDRAFIVFDGKYGQGTEINIDLKQNEYNVIMSSLELGVTLKGVPYNTHRGVVKQTPYPLQTIARLS